MLSGNESISHYSRSNFAIWMVMCLQAGILNMGGFLTCHRFVSHVTGFATFFGNEVSDGHWTKAMGMFSVPAFFLLGAMLSAQMVDIRLKLRKKPKYYISFGVMFALMLLILLCGIKGYFGVFSEPFNHERDYVLLALLCLVCGIQNGTITSVSRSVVRTTHLTGLTTDLGIGLIRVLNRKKLHDHIGDEVYINLLRIGIIFSFSLGCVIGGFAFKQLGYLGFLLPVLISGGLFALMLYAHLFKQPA